MKTLKHLIQEMAYSQSKAIDILDDGSQVILEHWLKLHVVEGPELERNAHQWTISIDKWFDKFARIKLKGSNHPPSLKQGIKWFFHEGAESKVDDIIREIKVISREYPINKSISYVELAESYRNYITQRFEKELNWK